MPETLVKFHYLMSTQCKGKIQNDDSVRGNAYQTLQCFFVCHSLLLILDVSDTKPYIIILTVPGFL